MAKRRLLRLFIAPPPSARTGGSRTAFATLRQLPVGHDVEADLTRAAQAPAALVLTGILATVTARPCEGELAGPLADRIEPAAAG
jgi:hypothetical protein